MKGFFRPRLSWLFLLALPLLLLALPGEAKPAKILDIADSVSTNRILTRFAAMLQASDLATFLSSKGPFTVFAPTDSAFSKLPPGMLDTLLRPENKERLQHILLYHVVNGKKLTAKDLLTTTTLLSCDDLPLQLKTNKLGTQLVFKAKVIHADIRCQNGLIHQIDSVLLPPESSLPPIAAPPPPTPPPIPETNAAPADTNAPPSVSSETNAPPAETSTNIPTATPFSQ